MIYSPKQTSEIWCPMVRRYSPNGSYNQEKRVSGNVDLETCIADKCAMWRWVPTGETMKQEKIVDDGGGQKRIMHIDVPTKPTQGYCGLAGSPL